MNRPTFHHGRTWFGGHTLWITALTYGVIASQSFPTAGADVLKRQHRSEQVLDFGWKDLPVLSEAAGLLCWILRCDKQCAVNADLKTQRASAAVAFREVYHHSLQYPDQMWTERPSGNISGCHRCERQTERPLNSPCCPACSYRQQRCAEIQITADQTNKNKTHPKWSMMVYFTDGWEPLECFA